MKTTSKTQDQVDYPEACVRGHMAGFADGMADHIAIQMRLAAPCRSAYARAWEQSYAEGWIRGREFQKQVES